LLSSASIFSVNMVMPPHSIRGGQMVAGEIPACQL